MKLFSKIILMVTAVAGLASCSDVPSPYELHYDPSAAKTMPYKNASLNENFTATTVNGIAWSLGSTYAKASGYDSDDKSYTATEAWLVSPAINTTTTENKAMISFDYVVRYGASDETSLKANHRVLASTDYDGDVTKATWTDLGFVPTQGSSWTFTTKEIALPENIVNQERVVFAFVYTSGSTQATCSTWELENFIVKAGEPSAEEPSTDSGSSTTFTGKGTLDSPYSVAQANSIIKAGTYTTDNVYVAGVISQIDDISTSYGNATYYISDDGTTTNQLEVFRGYGVDGAKFSTGSEIKVGDKVVVCGTLTLYYSTYEITTGSKIVSLNGTTTGGSSSGSSTGSNTGSGSISGTAGTVTIDDATTTLTSSLTAGTESVSIDLNTLGYTATTVMSSPVSLSDGSTITFDKGTNSNTPTFYTATKGVRVYANNTITFSCKKNIAKIVITCDAYNGTNYVGQTTATVTFDGTTAVYTNAGSGTTQLRAKTITIYYAN